MRVVASECCSGLFPKNTLSGFKHCIDAGYDGVEFDVHLSADGFVVVQHDFLLNAQITRDPYGQWLKKPGPAVSQLTRSELKTYDVGRYRSGSQEEKDYRNYAAIDSEQIPMFDEFLQYYQSNNRHSELWVEIKSSPFQRDISANPEDLLNAVLGAITSAGVEKKTFLLAFEWELLIRAKELCPEIQTDFLSIDPKYIVAMHKNQGLVDASLLYGSFDPKNYGGSVPSALRAAGANWWGPLVSDVTKRQVSEAQDLGLKVNLWGVESTPQGIDQARDTGADAITLARPDLVDS
jgi:glycerophosphoryl diester phosphodiesterase